MTLTAVALLAAALLVGGHTQPGRAQGQPQADAPPPTETPSVLPRPDFHCPGNVGRTYLDADPPQFPQPVQAPQGAPNVVLILIDDVGFGQFSTFGGGVPVPRKLVAGLENLCPAKAGTFPRAW
jgi:arylsulfatase